MSDLPSFGPFKVEKFLVTPSKIHSQQNILQLEDFVFYLDSRQHSRVGLDILNEDDYALQRTVNSIGLNWRGYVVFSDEAKNRKHISMEGFDAIAEQLNQRASSLNWETGFKVELEGKYWRHSYERDKTVPSAFLHRLLVDLDSVFVPVNGKQEQANRRFRVTSMHEEFKRKSRMMIKYNLVLIMEHINLEIGQPLQPSVKTVDWYQKYYSEMFPAKREDVGIFDGLFIPATEFKKELSRYVYSLSLQAELRRKRLLSQNNISQFIETIPRQRGNAAQPPRQGDRQGPGNNPLELQGLIEMEGNPSDIEELPLTDEEDARPSNVGSEVDQLMDDSDLFTDTAPQVSREMSAASLAGPNTHIRNASTSTAASLASPTTATSKGTSKASIDVESKQLLQFVPKEILQRPKMPADCRWQCPVEGCSFVVDFKGGLPIASLRLLSESDKAFLKRKSWSASSTLANHILLKIASPHFKEHLKELGLEIHQTQIRRISETQG